MSLGVIAPVTVTQLSLGVIAPVTVTAGDQCTRIKLIQPVGGIIGQRARKPAADSGQLVEAIIGVGGARRAGKIAARIIGEAAACDSAVLVQAVGGVGAIRVV